jgi:hypothetical protein
MLVVQASNTPSPKQPLGQRREFTHFRRSAVSPRATIVRHCTKTLSRYLRRRWLPGWTRVQKLADNLRTPFRE